MSMEQPYQGSNPSNAKLFQPSNFVHKNLPEKECRIIISQILYGLEYMNKLQKRIIHYDLKPQNIIFNNMEVKISDFGLSVRLYQDTEKPVGTGLFPVCWTAPEVLRRQNYSTFSDVWSFGVVMWEIFELGSKKPYGDKGWLQSDDLCDSCFSLNGLFMEWQKPGPDPTKIFLA